MKQVPDMISSKDLSYLEDIFGASVTTLYSTEANITKCLKEDYQEDVEIKSVKRFKLFGKKKKLPPITESITDLVSNLPSYRSIVNIKEQ